MATVKAEAIQTSLLLDDYWATALLAAEAGLSSLETKWQDD